MSESYTGPATVVPTPEEWLLIWKALSLIPTMENASIRKKIKDFLESQNTDAS